MGRRKKRVLFAVLAGCVLIATGAATGQRILFGQRTPILVTRVVGCGQTKRNKSSGW